MTDGSPQRLESALADRYCFFFFLDAVSQGVEADAILDIVTNWFTELRERMGEGR